MKPCTEVQAKSDMRCLMSPDACGINASTVAKCCRRIASAAAASSGVSSRLPSRLNMSWNSAGFAAAKAM